VTDAHESRRRVDCGLDSIRIHFRLILAGILEDVDDALNVIMGGLHPHTPSHHTASSYKIDPGAIPHDSHHHQHLIIIIIIKRLRKLTCRQLGIPRVQNGFQSGFIVESNSQGSIGACFWDPPPPISGHFWTNSGSILAWILEDFGGF